MFINVIYIYMKMGEEKDIREMVELGKLRKRRTQKD
jgi:hypothetical protein